MSAQIDPHNIVLYRSVYTGTQIDTLLGLIRPAKDLAEGLEVRVRTIEDQLSPQVILTIQQMEFAGGTSVQSPAGGEVIAVEDLARGYKLYFDTNNGSEPVLFHVNDQAMGRRYDIGTTVGNYYWRLVTEVGADYIVLSKTDCDAGSGVPAVGDKVITLGARYDTTRQNVKVSTTIGENRDEWYAGINTYNLENKLVTVVGVKDGQVGIWTQNGYFSGEIHITNGEGLENLEEWQAVAQQISDAWEKALKAETDASNAQYTADQAVLQAERIELMLARINSDAVLDIAEKKVLRTEWITINGLEDLDRSGEKGSYIKTKLLYSQYSNLGGRVLFTYGGKAYTFNGKAYTFVSIGIAALDAAYLALREYLSEVALNDRTTVFEGFDRQHLADLLTNYYDAEKQVNDNITAAVKERIEQAKAEVLAELTGFQEAIEQQIEEMQGVIDNTIETHFHDGAPSLVSPPASEWLTDEEKRRHLGDLYYDNITGYAYRFQFNSSTGTYYWNYLQDSALAKALAAAARAQDTADGKRRTFLSQPTAADAYDPGDMWLHATVGDYTNETLVCITAKAAGVSFSAAHWTKASKYTDDTVANAAAAAASAAQTTANNAANAAAAAQTAADNAAQAAATANTRLTNWASDGSISPVEKEALRQQKTDVTQEYGEYINQANTYSVDTTAYASAYTAALAALNKYTAATPENITIEADYDNIAAYYTARTTLAQAIATAAKKVATDAQAAADAAQATANQAVGLANAAQVAANAAQAAANAAQSTADAAAAAAAAAQTAADAAQDDADAANTRLNGWASDLVISPLEKEALRQQKTDIQGEYLDVINQCTRYNVSSTAYASAYTAAITALNKYTSTAQENITIEADYAYIGAYYTARSTVMQAVAAAAKAEAEAAQAAADAAQADADAAAAAAAAAQGTANSALTAAQNAQAAADTAQSAANTAQAAAAAAQADATAANTRLTNWASDGSISPVEKNSLKQQKGDISAEYAGILQQAQAYALSTAAYTSAYEAAMTALNKYTAASPENITITSDYANIAAYYTARTTITQAIAAAAKAAADAAQATADNAIAQAVRLKEALEHINSDDVLDIAEKKSLRTEWITINGLEDLDRSGSRGSYYITKQLLSQYTNLGRKTVFTFNGKVLTFNGKVYTFLLSGTGALDAAYLALREYLSEVGLNDRTTTFDGFDRQHLADLLTAYYDAERQVNDSISQAIKEDIEAAKAEVLAELGSFQALMEQQLEEMQDVVDNTIETHFAGGTPTLNNYPANEWTTEELKKRHLGDLYYDNAPKGSGSGQSPTSGFAFRFERTGTEGHYVYSWHQLNDNAIAQALAAAAAAQDTADGKRRTFLSQPTTADAYDPGDMWLHATIGNYTNETLVCLTAKAAGTVFQAAHWGLASKYTDDTVANLARTEAAAAQTTANNAASAASAAQTAADNAASAAATANSRLNGWASDQVISPLEKEALRQQKTDIQGEYQDVINQCTRYSVSSTAYSAAYTAAITALNKYTAASPENITIGNDYANIGAYYTARSTVMQAVAAAAKAEAEAAQAAADAAQQAADVADGKAEAAAEAAAAVARAVANINDDTILDPSEKGEVRTTWISINGILSTSENGTTGTYAAAKEAIAKAAGAAFPTVFTFKGKVFTFNGKVYTFSYLGAAALDAAYLALREFLSGLQINSTGYFLGFDRSQYSSLLRDYNVALNKVLQALSDIATQKADDALSSIELINAVLEKFGSDGYISSQEKLTLKTALDDESAAHSTLQAQATRYNTQEVQTALTAYETAYTRFGNVVTYYCSNFPWSDDVPVSSGYPLSYISAYYTAKEALINAINAAEKAIIDTKAANSDYSYLKDALPNNAFTQVTGGLVLANILGVKNANGNVVAAMNGLATLTGFNDATHGVLMFAAGITDVSTAKTTAATRIFSDGTIITNKLQATGGEIKSLVVKQTRNPFSEVTSSFDAIDDDTVYSYTLSGHLVGTLDWTPASSGRRMVLAGSFSISAPSGEYYFYENGRKSKTLESSKELTELIGFGTASVFRGWIVLNRQLFQTTYNFGRTITPLAFGKVTGTSSSASFSIVKYTSDGSKVDDEHVIRVNRKDTGVYELIVPRQWFVDSGYIYVDLVGIGNSYGATDSPVKATLGAITTSTYPGGFNRWNIEVLVSDDATRNDGSFLFRLYNMAQWDD